MLEVLRLGAYQVLYMDAVPSFAAVSESVDLVRSAVGGRPAGLVNAVLRRVAEDGAAPSLFPDPETDPAGWLETWGSHPRWLVDRWLDRWPVESVRALVDADNRRPAVFLTTLDVPPAEAVRMLAAASVDAEIVPGAPASVRLGDGTDPATALEAVPGSFVQDPAAAWVARYADVPSGSEVADLCAAPGGKALAVAGRTARLVAADRSAARIRMVVENARRVGVPVSCVVADALRPPFRPVDVVLLDVPCSGTGTLGRHPDARWRLEPGSVAAFAELQEGMLDAAAEVVRPGGWLIYSTCTLEPEENGDRIDAFLGKHPGFRVEAPDAVSGELLDERGRLVVTPQATGFDGAFAARMRRTR